ncbi:MAG: PQQ-binding-like beta-propeller repeat protein [Phycisphaera sp.]|nr:PQQ-binding-like beta-propeller repeat protein [Phycisphaera sp.]
MPYRLATVARLTMFALALAAATIAGQAAHAQEWTRFRGPNGAGVSDCKTIPTKWAASDYRWRVDLPGEGHGAPVLWGDKLFVLSADEATATRFVISLDARDGGTRWVKQYASSKYAHHKFNRFGSTTPAVDDERVYVYWTTPEKITLMALDHGGNEVWKREDLGPFDSQHGNGTSPIVYKDLLILTNDQIGPSSIIAVDKRTGKTKWIVDRGTGESGATAYSVPSIRNVNGRDELICNARLNGITSIDPETGKVNWQVREAGGTPLFKLRSVSSSVTVGDLVIGTCGSGGGGNYLVAIRPPSEPSSKADLVYKIDKSAPYVPTPLHVDGLLFLVWDGGVATCLDAKTGDVKWRERLGGDFFGSPVCVNGYIYVINRNGDVVVFKAGDKYEPVSVNPLGELSYSTPAVANGRMYLRSLGHLTCIGAE